MLAAPGDIGLSEVPLMTGGLIDEEMANEIQDILHKNKQGNGGNKHKVKSFISLKFDDNRDSFEILLSHDKQ